jgi:hypothetical protein
MTRSDAVSSYRLYLPSAAAQEASDYYNALPYEERRKLAPLLDHYRQMGLAEAEREIAKVTRFIGARVQGIREADLAAPRDEQAR